MTANPKIAYFDSSVILRYAVGHERAIKDLSAYASKAVTSAITVVECLRVLDRWRITSEVGDHKLIAARSLCLQILNGLRIIAIDDQVIALASQTFPIAMKSLDAIHLSSVIHFRNQGGPRPVLLTHDERLQMAALAMEVDCQFT
jgi:predicted nucleic acid-binding protein